jgi:hypothetical protein
MESKPAYGLPLALGSLGRVWGAQGRVEVEVGLRLKKMGNQTGVVLFRREDKTPGCVFVCACVCVCSGSGVIRSLACSSGKWE